MRRRHPERGSEPGPDTRAPGTGLRASELANLELANVDFTAQRMLIKHAKGNKQRVVRFGERARQALEHYIRAFRGEATGPGDRYPAPSRSLNVGDSAPRHGFARCGEGGSGPRFVQSRRCQRGGAATPAPSPTWAALTKRRRNCGISPGTISRFFPATAISRSPWCC
ncbi:MAG: hypothetical protein DRI30_06400 [Chloroflexi bacterium]|nr:MAG: hypothetical protein DRI30_06400 [Chloroflexota bacterium]